MRTLSSTLQTAQESKSRKECPRLVLTHNGTSYTYEGGQGGRILGIDHSEQETSHRTTVLLNNSDGAMTALDLKGYDAVYSDGMITTAGKEYSSHAPLKVLGQRFDSAPGNLVCTLQLIGKPDRLKEDKANADYEHHWSSTKTVKELFTEIADGNPVSEELTAKQETQDNYQALNNVYVAAGQRITLSKTVTKLSFKLKKTGSPSGDITFRILDSDTEAELGSKVWGDAGSLSTSGVWREATFTSPVVIDQEVYLLCQFTTGDAGNYVQVAYNSENVVVSENFVHVLAAGANPVVDWTDLECAYRYKYTYAGIDVYDDCDAYEVVYDSEDSLIDTYVPADSFTIREGESRLSG